MNVVSTSSTDFIQENASGSDSDTNPDETTEYYQPISAVDNADDEQDQDPDQVNSDEEHHNHQASDSDIHQLPNGYCTHEAENRISSLDLNDDVEDDNDDEEEEEERRLREASDSAMLRAFREDESRRNAPLSAENAVRVMEAMRGVSFVGLTPDWAHRVPEDRWIHGLRRLRQQPPQTSSSTTLQN